MIKSVVRVLVVLFSLLLNIPIFAQPADLQKLIHAVDSLKTAAPNSFDYVLALDAVASHYFTSGDYKTALPYREECLKVITQQRDESDNAVLLIKTFLADTYSRLDRHKDAIDLYLECAGIYAKEIPPREDYFYALNCLVVEYLQPYNIGVKQLILYIAFMALESNMRGKSGFRESYLLQITNMKQLSNVLMRVKPFLNSKEKQTQKHMCNCSKTSWFLFHDIVVNWSKHKSSHKHGP